MVGKERTEPVRTKKRERSESSSIYVTLSVNQILRTVKKAKTTTRTSIEDLPAEQIYHDHHQNRISRPASRASSEAASYRSGSSRDHPPLSIPSSRQSSLARHSSVTSSRHSSVVSNGDTDFKGTRVNDYGGFVDDDEIPETNLEMLVGNSRADRTTQSSSGVSPTMMSPLS